MGSLPVRVINQNNLECAQWQNKLCNPKHFLTNISEGEFKIKNKKASDYLSGSALGKKVLIKVFLNIKFKFKICMNFYNPTHLEGMLFRATICGFSWPIFM
jgi:hypothetical protein